MEVFLLKLPLHGSNPSYLYQSLKLSMPEKTIDFSVNINPYGPPPIIQEKWSSFFQSMIDYPDPHCLKLKELISNREGVNQNQIFIGNGASELIYIIANALLREKKVLIVEPTFSEYKKACETFSCHVSSFLLSSEKNWELHAEDLISLIEKVDAIFICNPNNPTGVFYPKEELERIIEEAKQQNTYVVIDEAFYDFSTQPISMARYVKDYNNLIILRSMTKMFAIAGIRLGYALCHESLIEKLKVFQPEWSVNAVAQQIGVLCLQDKKHVQKTQSLVAEERKRVFSYLDSLHFHVTSSQINFYLLSERNNQHLLELMKFLLQHGIVPRHTYNFDPLNGRYLRLAIKTKDENNRLIEVLEKWRKTCSYS